MSIERCYNCDQPTGNAGKGEDSLFYNNYGPFCKKCFEGCICAAIKKIQPSAKLYKILLESPKDVQSSHAHLFAFLKSHSVGKNDCEWCGGNGGYQTDDGPEACFPCRGNGYFSPSMQDAASLTLELHEMILNTEEVKDIVKEKIIEGEL